jgi:hypothetical protein
MKTYDILKQVRTQDSSLWGVLDLRLYVICLILVIVL